MNENVVFWFNQGLLQLGFSEYFQANPSLFSGTTTIDEVVFSWIANSAPTLSINAVEPNLSLEFSDVQLTAQNIAGGADLTVTINANVALANAVLSITDAIASVSGAENFIDDMIAAMVNQVIQDDYAGAISNVPVPTLPNVLGDGLSIDLQDAIAGAGFLQITASVTFNGWGPSETMPPVFSGDANGSPQGGIALNYAGVQTVMASVAGQFPITQSIDDEQTHKEGFLGHFGYGVQGDAVIALPEITISGAAASAVTTINPSINGGIEAFGEWTWVPLPVLPAAVSLNVALGTNSTNSVAQIQVSSVDSINYPSIDIPSVLSSVAAPLIDLIEAIESSLMSSQLQGQIFPIVTLPSGLPSPFAGVCSFNQLTFVNSGVGVLIDVAPLSAGATH